MPTCTAEAATWRFVGRTRFKRDVCSCRKCLTQLLPSPATPASQVSGGDMRKTITTLQVGRPWGHAASHYRGQVRAVGGGCCAALPAYLSLFASNNRPPVPPLQSAVRLRGSPVEPGAIMDVAGAVPASAVQGLLEAARSGQFSSIQQVRGLGAQLLAIKCLLHPACPAPLRRISCCHHAGHACPSGMHSP